MFGLIFFTSLALNLSNAYANSNDVLLCKKEKIEECSCPDETTLIQTEFHVSVKNLKGLPYRCVPEAEAVIQALPTIKIVQAFPLVTKKESACVSSTKEPLPLKNPECRMLPQNACLTTDFPKDCGYNWHEFDLKAYKETINTMLDSGTILCGDPHNAMCTSATFLFFLKQAQIWANEGKITKETLNNWKTIPSDAWKFINNQARPDLLVDSLTFADGKKIGTSKVLRQGDLPDAEWPKPGDYVQIWRKSLSGHSVVFQGYMKDEKGKAVGVCYWSANTATNGYGKMCEPIDTVNTMTVARFEK